MNGATDVPAVRDTLISTVVGVVVVTSVLRVSRVKRLHTERASKEPIGDFERPESLLRCE